MKFGPWTLVGGSDHELRPPVVLDHLVEEIAKPAPSVQRLGKSHP
jgi:hypothetical protein